MHAVPAIADRTTRRNAVRVASPAAMTTTRTTTGTRWRMRLGVVD